MGYFFFESIWIFKGLNSRLVEINHIPHFSFIRDESYNMLVKINNIVIKNGYNTNVSVRYPDPDPDWAYFL